MRDLACICECSTTNAVSAVLTNADLMDKRHVYNAMLTAKILVKVGYCLATRMHHVSVQGKASDAREVFNHGLNVFSEGASLMSNLVLNRRRIVFFKVDRRHSLQEFGLLTIPFNRM